MEQSTHRTHLYPNHLAAKAKMVAFHGWLMPLHYGSQTQEHLHVRTRAGVFDVSHMMITDIQGPDRLAFLQFLLANDVGRLKHPGQGLYSLMLNEAGGIIDDLIVYGMQDYYRLVTNAGTRVRVSNWLASHSEAFDVQMQCPDLSILAVQGPGARQALADVLGDQGACLWEIRKFYAVVVNDWLVARTGYTGEDGFEVMLQGQAARHLWDSLVAQGVRTCGLGARDTLRLEAGLNLYGADMDETTLPAASNLAWTLSCSSDRDFIGCSAVLSASDDQALIGLIMDKGPVPRAGCEVRVPGSEGLAGRVTSGSFSVSLDQNIALARVQLPVQADYEVQIRSRSWCAKTTALPFLKKICSVP